MYTLSKIFCCIISLAFSFSNGLKSKGFTTSGLEGEEGLELIEC